MDKQTCFNKLLKELNKYNIDYDKKEKVKFVDKFINLLNNEDNLNKWIKNLEKLNQYGHSNFIELVNYLKRNGETK